MSTDRCVTHNLSVLLLTVQIRPYRSNGVDGEILNAPSSVEWMGRSWMHHLLWSGWGDPGCSTFCGVDGEILNAAAAEFISSWVEGWISLSAFSASLGTTLLRARRERPSSWMPGLHPQDQAERRKSGIDSVTFSPRYGKGIYCYCFRVRGSMRQRLWAEDAIGIQRNQHQALSWNLTDEKKCVRT